ncbi:MAG: hypothetical protein AAFX52_04765 [Pseudomonadota bacterium]
MIITLLAAVSAMSMNEDVMAALKAQAAAYQARPTCSVTVAADIDTETNDGPRDENLLLRYDHLAESWTALEGPENPQDNQSERPTPRDWYVRALTMAAAAESAETQEDGTIVLYTENLPKGTLMDQQEGRDNSKRSRAETTVSMESGEPVITAYTVSLKKSFRIPLVVRVKDFSEEMIFGQSDDYGPLATSRTNIWDVSFTGGYQRGTAKLSYTDYDCPA